MKTHLCFSLLFSIFILSSFVYANDKADSRLAIDENYVNYNYLDETTRLGLSINDQGNFSADVLQVFGQKDDSTYLAQGWYGKGGAAGIKLNYHWLNSDKNRLFKTFLAVDQNEQKDKKASLGAGHENDKHFFGAYLSGALTGSRQLSSLSNSVSSPLTGQDEVGTWILPQTFTTVTTRYAQAYKYGLGLRAGQYFDNKLLRLRVGADYEWGQYHSHQWTYSLGMEKFFASNSHSVALDLQHLQRAGDYENNRRDSRFLLSWRYSFGQGSNPSATRMVNKKQLVSTVTSLESYQVVKHEVEMDSDLFFKLDSAKLRQKSLTEIEKLVEEISQQKLVSKISLVGHTCDLGSDEYNKELSERRANSVRDQLVQLGIPKEIILTEGRGEAQPKVPNTNEENRRRNRRVDINFLVATIKQEKIPAITNEKMEVVNQPVAWFKHALLNPIQHKREVDVYHFETTSTSKTTGTISYTNHKPSLIDDAASINRNSGATLIDVLANDSDADGNTLSIVSVTQPTIGGRVENFGNIVSFTPDSDFNGVAEFRYSVEDGQGGLAEAIVKVSVLNNAPIAVDDVFYTPMLPSININVLNNDSDPDGDALSVVSLDGLPDATIGLFNINEDNTITLIPTDWNGITPININYFISDNLGGSDSAKLTIIDP